MPDMEYRIEYSDETRDPTRVDGYWITWTAPLREVDEAIVTARRQSRRYPSRVWRVIKTVGDGDVPLAMFYVPDALCIEKNRREE